MSPRRTSPLWHLLLTACLLGPTAGHAASLEEVAVALPPAAPPAPAGVSETLSEAPATHPPAPRHSRCIRVVDGDTLVLEGDERVRLLNVNTPEKKEPFGPEAGQFTRDFTLMKEVDLVYSASTERDHYGRLLAEVYVDGHSLAEALLAQGLAHVFLVAPGLPPANADVLMQTQARARAEKRNVWATDRYSGTLHITSFHANARGNDKENLMGEYLRVANLTGAPLDVSGYTLTNAEGRVLTLPAMVIPAGYSFQIISGRGVANADPTRGPLQVFWGSDWPIFLNSGDSATLRDAQGTVLDRVVYAPANR